MRPPPTSQVSLTAMPNTFEWGRTLVLGEFHFEAVVRTTLAEGGRFELAVPQPGSWLIRLEAPGYVPLQYAVTALVPAAGAPLGDVR